MARLDTYKKDVEVNGLDYLAGSSYVTTGINGPVYETTKFSMLDLARFFGSYTNINGFTYDIAQMYTDIQNNITSLASVGISITALADATQALAQVDIDLQTAFSNGISAAVSEINLTLTSLSNEDLALASVITDLETSFTTELSTAVSTINTSLTALTTADSALATSITELETTFTTDLSEAVATINTELTTLSTADEALATSITTLETTFTTDLATANAAITSEATARATADLAEATAREALEVSLTTQIGVVSAAVTTETTARTTADTAIAEEITTLTAAIETETTARTAAITTVNQAIVDETSARTTSDTTLNTAISIKPNIFRQASAPAVTEPVGSVWYDTDDNNKTYVLTAGSPNVWTVTDDARIGATITSLATAQESIGTLSTNLSSEATKITKLQAQYTFDANGDVDGLASGTIVSNAVNNAYSSAVADAESATATAITSLSATISKVYRQDAEPTGTIPTNSIWYDTNDSNKSYVYNGTSWVYTVDATLATTASVDTVQSAIGGINGKLEAQYGLKVSAGGAIAGMTLSASATDEGATSSVVFQADQFNIKTDSGTKTPFSVSGDTVTMSNVVVAGTVSIGGTTASTLVSNASIGATAIQPSDNISALTNDAGFQNSTQVNAADKTDGTVAGWSIDSNYIWSGTKQTTNTYSTSGITLFNGGAIRTPQFYIDHTNGNAFFKGTITVGETILTETNTLNTNTTKNDVGLGNVDNTSDATVLSSAATAANNATKTAGAVGPVTITSTSLYQGTGNYGNADTGFFINNEGKFSLKDKLTFDGTNLVVNGSGTFTGSLSGASITGATGTFSGNVTAGNVTISEDLITFGTTEASYGDAGKISFKDSSSAEVGSIKVTSGGQTRILSKYNTVIASEVVYRQTSAPSVTLSPLGSLWIDTDAGDTKYILSYRTPPTANVWELAPSADGIITMFGVGSGSVTLGNVSSPFRYLNVDTQLGTTISGDFKYANNNLGLIRSYTGATSNTLSKNYVRLPKSNSDSFQTIMQWGYQTGSATNVAITFPIAFPTACRSVSVTVERNIRSGEGANYATSVTASGFTAVTDTANDFWWIAFGD